MRATDAHEAAPADASLDAADAADAADTAPPAYLVFVTSVSHGGTFGGFDGGDTMCNTLAQAAKLPGTYAAWLSGSNGVAAATRITSPGPWRLETGGLVAATMTELASGTLQHAIDHDESGVAVVNGRAWTGTGANGTYLTNDCGLWTNGSVGRIGSTSATDSTWTSIDTDDCGNQHRLYCFEL